ncbi:MAG TPA: MBL fold metallo-hydrolase [Vicinamibacterales bacterium]|nr:MBL fold metallo-hydrolase [Vicinamibacterales bacterium]
MNIVPIHAANPGPMTGEGNWTWLLPGTEATLIDAGTGAPRHLAALDDALRGAPLAQVLVTHAHTDHASGAPAIATRHQETRFRKMLWRERDAKWPVPYEPIADGDRIAAGDTSLVAIHTPGHAPDHLCFWHEDSRTLFCGDLAVKGGTVWIPASLQGDLAAYLASLERVIALAPARLMPAHGPVIEEPETVLRGYIDHRLEREQQILDALRHGDQTPDEIVARVYRGLKPQLLPMAQEGVIAHLVKLEAESRVRQDADRWLIVG